MNYYSIINTILLFPMYVLLYFQLEQSMGKIKLIYHCLQDTEIIHMNCQTCTVLVHRLSSPSKWQAFCVF